MTRFGFISSAFAAALMVSACARPAPPVTTGPAVPTGPLQVTAADVVVDVSELQSDEGVAVELVEDFLEFHAAKLTRNDEAGRKAKPVIRVRELKVASKNFASILPERTSLFGEVSLVDAVTGEVIVPPSELDVDLGPHIPGELVGVVTRSRAEMKAEKAATEFMQRARVVLYGPNN